MSQEIPSSSEKGGLATGQQVELLSIPLPVTVQYTARTVMVHTVTSTELDTVASLSNSLIAFWTVLTTTKITDSFTHAVYVALLAVSAVGAAYFGIRAIIDYRESRRKLKEIKCGKN